MTEGDGKKRKLEERKERDYDKMIRERENQSKPSRDSLHAPGCIHCGQPFDPHLSSGGAYGICQSCVDD